MTNWRRGFSQSLIKCSKLCLERKAGRVNAIPSASRSYSINVLKSIRIWGCSIKKFGDLVQNLKSIFRKVLTFFCIAMATIPGGIIGAILGAITGVLFGGKGGSSDAVGMIMSWFVGKKAGGTTGKITGGICGQIIRLFD